MPDFRIIERKVALKKAGVVASVLSPCTPNENLS
jgi:hypothetical protein